MISEDIALLWNSLVPVKGYTQSRYDMPYSPPGCNKKHTAQLHIMRKNLGIEKQNEPQS